MEHSIELKFIRDDLGEWPNTLRLSQILKENIDTHLPVKKDYDDQEGEDELLWYY